MTYLHFPRTVQIHCKIFLNNASTKIPNYGRTLRLYANIRGLLRDGKHSRYIFMHLPLSEVLMRIMQELRPQDSIPFLRRVSTDLQRTDVAKLLAHVGVPIVEASTSEATPQEVSRPPTRRPSIVPVSALPDETTFTPRDHTFIKTTFGKREFTATFKLECL